MLSFLDPPLPFIWWFWSTFDRVFLLLFFWFFRLDFVDFLFFFLLTFLDSLLFLETEAPMMFFFKNS